MSGTYHITAHTNDRARLIVSEHRSSDQAVAGMIVEHLKRRGLVVSVLTYEQFLVESEWKQREYVGEQQDRMRQAETLWRTYERAMHQIGLHPLTRQEIEDRQRELARMESDAGTKSAVTEATRTMYEFYCDNHPEETP